MFGNISMHRFIVPWKMLGSAPRVGADDCVVFDQALVEALRAASTIITCTGSR